jgi:hypothetical protein
MNVIQALWFNVTCNCKLMRAVKEENSPNYNLKQLEETSVGDLKAECHRLYMGRSPNYGRNSNILIPDPYH